MNADHGVTGALPVGDGVRMGGGDEDERPVPRSKGLLVEGYEELAGGCGIGSGADPGGRGQDDVSGYEHLHVLGGQVDHDPVRVCEKVRCALRSQAVDPFGRVASRTFTQPGSWPVGSVATSVDPARTGMVSGQFTRAIRARVAARGAALGAAACVACPGDELAMARTAMATPAAMTADTTPSATRERLTVLATRPAAASVSFHIWVICRRAIPDLGRRSRDCRRSPDVG